MISSEARTSATMRTKVTGLIGKFLCVGSLGGEGAQPVFRFGVGVTILTIGAVGL